MNPHVGQVCQSFVVRHSLQGSEVHRLQPCFGLRFQHLSCPMSQYLLHVGPESCAQYQCECYPCSFHQYKLLFQNGTSKLPTLAQQHDKLHQEIVLVRIHNSIELQYLEDQALPLLECWLLRLRQLDVLHQWSCYLPLITTI